MNQEELNIEKAASIYCECYEDHNKANSVRIAFKNGAMSKEAKQYHQKNMYSEDEVKKLIYLYLSSNTYFKVKNEMALPKYINEWFENNKSII